MGERVVEGQVESFSRMQNTGKETMYKGLPFVGFLTDGNLPVFSLRYLENKGFSTAVMPVLIQGKLTNNVAVYQSPEAVAAYDRIVKLPEYHTLYAALHYDGNPNKSKDYLGLSKLPNWDSQLKERVDRFFWERLANKYGGMLNQLQSSWWSRLTQGNDIKWAKTIEEGCKKKAETLARDLPKLTIDEIHGLLEQAIDKLLSESS